MSKHDRNKQLIDNFIKEAQEKHAQLISGKKTPIMGWCSTYVPEEILMAAGFLPYRVMGAPVSLSLSKSYLAGNLCPSIQSILECALKGDYGFLDGIVIGGMTDATKRLYDAWKQYGNTPFCHIFHIPKLINDAAIWHYKESIFLLIEYLQDHFKIKINDSDIADAISVCNKTRQLLTDLNDLRRDENPPISSQQMLEVSRLAMISDKKIYNIALEALLKKITLDSSPNPGFRVLLTGSFQDQSWFLDIIESTGAKVVCEDMCTRLRYFSGLVDDNTDLIDSISKRYINSKPPSASLVSLEQRSKHILKLIDEFNVDAVIYYIIKFDDPYLFEFPDMKEILVSHDIPVLRIETEHNTNAMGQVSTRIEAFIETLKHFKPVRVN
ncbi:2-hydroxyacyl-CoA dehydratase subunit D [Candidatus Omnitrophota bacterium]